VSSHFKDYIITFNQLTFTGHTPFKGRIFKYCTFYFVYFNNPERFRLHGVFGLLLFCHSNLVQNQYFL